VRSPAIVIVSADPTFGYLVARNCTDRGYVAHLFRTEADAHTFLQQHRPFGVLLEVMLEGAVSGMLTVERIRSNPETWDVPIAVCSCDPRFLSTYAGYLQGRNCDIFGKPFDLTQVLAAIRSRHAVNNGLGCDTLVANAFATAQAVH
jgi:DNA-binding response OmpR family regulator